MYMAPNIADLMFFLTRDTYSTTSISVSDLSPHFLTTALCSFKSGRSCMAIIGGGFGVGQEVTSHLCRRVWIRVESRGAAFHKIN